MFKSIQWKLVMMFVLLVISVIIVVGIYLSSSVTSFYHDDFKKKMDRVFNNDDIDFSGAAVSTDQLDKVLKSFIGMLGIDTYRNYFILNPLGGVYQSSNMELAGDLEYTPNMIRAMRGKKTVDVKNNKDYMDYAIPIMERGKTKFIIYIRDEKNDLNEMTSELFNIILKALAVGLGVSMIMGYFLSSTITIPIASLTKKAEKMAAGDFEQMLEAKSDDEIGKLTNTFNYMASELKHTLEEIASEKNKAETILLNMTDGVMAFNVDGTLIHANPVSRNILNIQTFDDKEANFDEFFKSLNADISIGELIYLDNNKTLEREIEINDVHLKASFAAFKVEKEKVGGVVVVLQDITEQQKLDAARREFVANVSHELRTPLTSIKSYAETLLDGALDDRETAVSFLKVVNNESDRMTRLVKDLLILSRLGDKQVQWNKTYFSMKKLIDEVVEKLTLSAKHRKHRLTFTLVSSLPDIYGDRDRIEQVLKNIVSNAIKYTPDGGEISIFAGCVYNEVYVKIKDSGIGIPKEDLSRIFERFYRVDKARSREMGGTGLGLAIAKEIVLAHNGTLSIDSELDKGTEVTIKIPVA
ncbi:ATP-binding protein [Petroclostridium sp. X23]|uniref:ATP-binding protein n=1 Tax=Petroclostridium sp. X23 TaxID=3045146 RepID=UPI0024AD3F5B|nr:ATP-binding protein [Petroclostridium sp. X23]WHH57401.1 ATP-binding protein [Petroclostridium sp. X23]